MSSRLLAVAAAVALLGSACGDSSDNGSPPPSSSAAPAPSSTAPGSDSSTTAAPTTELAPTEFSNSSRGVTETEILVGIGIMDASAFGFDNGDQQAQWQAAIDRANEAGGVLGRTIVPVFESYLPVGSVEPEAACARHVEDEQVFAFIGALRENNELCYTELGETIVINTRPVNDEVIERSNGLVFSGEPLRLALEQEAVAALSAEGLVDGQRFHIRANPAEEPFIDTLGVALGSAGGEVVGTTVQNAGPGDVVAAAADADRAVERALADGADAIFAISDQGLAVAGAVERAGADLAVFSTSTEASTFLTFGYDLTAIDYLGLNRSPWLEVYESGDPDTVACIDNYETRSGNTVTAGVPAPAVDDFEPTIRTCRGIELFVAVATAAGPDLTNESFVEAASSLGDFSLTGASAASLGPDKAGADDTPLVLLRWNPEILAFSSVDSAG